MCFMPDIIMKIPRNHRSDVRRRLAVICHEAARLCFMPDIIMKMPRSHRSDVRRRLAVINIVESNQPDMRQHIRMQRKICPQTEQKFVQKQPQIAPTEHPNFIFVSGEHAPGTH